MIKMTLIAGLAIVLGVLGFIAPETHAQSSQILDISSHFVQDQIRSSGIIATKPVPFLGSIVGSQGESANLTQGDLVYIKLAPGKQVKPGDRYSIARWGKEIIHPASDEKIGNLVRVPGIVVILDGRGQIVPARIEKSFFAIVHGDLIIPPIPLPPLSMSIRFKDKIKGTVVAAAEDEENISERGVVFIDRGNQDGVITGDFFTIYQTPYFTEEAKENKAELPMLKVGEGVVVSVNKDTSTLMITNSLQSIYVGDTVLSGKRK
jgi:hypothetical protein